MFWASVSKYMLWCGEKCDSEREWIRDAHEAESTKTGRPGKAIEEEIRTGRDKKGDRRNNLARRLLSSNIIHMVHHSNKQIEEQFPTILYLILHRTATLKRVSRADDKCKIVRSQFRVTVRRIRISKARRRQNSRALDPRLQALFPECQLLQLLQSVLLSLAVDHCVLEDRTDVGVDDGFGGAVGAAAVFEIPALTLGVVFEARVVVAFVEVLEDGGKDFGVFVGEVDALVGAGEELVAAGGLEVGGVGQDVFVGCEEALLAADGESDDCTDKNRQS
jgi:hypothetical protein